MRGKRFSNTIKINDRRITPADAGKTRQIKSGESQLWDHPRGCGENLEMEKFKYNVPGSPPRMRGKPAKRC